MMLIADRNGMVSADKSAPTARDYVQDGLIAMWDGAENAGFGKHSADASSFVDLVSGGSVLVGPYGSSVNEVPAWTVESTGIRSNELNYSKMVGIAIPYTFENPGSNWTVEYARSIHIRDHHQGDSPVFNFNPYDSSANQSLTVYPYHVNQNNASSIRLRYSGQWAIKDKNGFTEGERDGLNVIGFTSSTIGGNSKCAYVNGGFVQKSTYIGNMYKDGNTTHLCISSSGFDVTIHSFRIYNRALTSEEMASNYAVDVKRFGGDI